LRARQDEGRAAAAVGRSRRHTARSIENRQKPVRICRAPALALTGAFEGTALSFLMRDVSSTSLFRRDDPVLVMTDRGWATGLYVKSDDDRRSHVVRVASVSEMRVFTVLESGIRPIAG
jgi:hypothetical protein